MKKLQYIINNKTIKHYHFDTIDSTQIYARTQRNTFKANEINIFSTDLQTNGIGQHNRRWISSKKSVDLAVTYGFLLDKKFSKNKTLIPHVAVCSVVDLLLSQKIDTKIKWVNDLLINRKKISGVLVESFNDEFISDEYNAYDSVIAGFGVNVNSSFDEIADLENQVASIQATSMKIEIKKRSGVEKDFDVEALIAKLTSIFLNNLDELYLNGFDRFRNKINTRLERFDNQKITFKKQDGSDYFGYIKEIDCGGELIMLNDEGEETSFTNGRIVL
jgi:BirA family transcriptional regulator, biotin operon repressor / biotin---[acetyl-CoA-carboxylase] ligase